MRWGMKVTLLLMLLWSVTGIGYANPEITVKLPGGANIEMVWIEPGTFMMGSPDAEDLSAYPQHQVTISRGFYLGKYELTQRQWSSVMGTTPWADSIGVQANPDNPAVLISWNDVQEFAHKLNQAAGDSLYRLPTEAEWEYACRSGTITQWSFGNDASLLGDYAWYARNTFSVGEPYAHAVGTKMPNPWGLFDMHGNVAEWVQDWIGVYSSSSQTDPTGPASGDFRVLRDGGFYQDAQSMRSAYRDYLPPEAFGYPVGVRLVKMGPASTLVTPQTWGEVKAGWR